MHAVSILVTFSEKKPKKSWFQMHVGEDEGPWEQWSISPLRSSLDLDLSTSPTFPTQQDRQHRTKTAKIESRYTMYSSHFIRAYTLLDRPFIICCATPPPPRHRSPRTQRHPRHHPHQSPPGHPHTSSEKGRTTVPLITNATCISPFPIRITVKVDGIETG